MNNEIIYIYGTKSANCIHTSFLWANTLNTQSPQNNPMSQGGVRLKNLNLLGCIVWSTNKVYEFLIMNKSSGKKMVRRFWNSWPGSSICGEGQIYGHLMLYCFHDKAAALPDIDVVVTGVRVVVVVGTTVVGWVAPHVLSPDWQWEHSYAMLHSCSITQSSSSM